MIYCSPNTVIGFHATLLKYFTHGARSHYVQDTVDTCQDDWWKNLLYINNFMVSRFWNLNLILRLVFSGMTRCA